MTPQPPPPFRRPPPPPVKEPEWVRRMKEGKHPAKDTTSTVIS